MNLAHSSPTFTKVASLALALACSSMAAQADTVLGIYAGAGAWQQEASGDVTSVIRAPASTALNKVDIENDLGLDDDTNQVFYVALEHGVPVLPNIRANYFDINMNGANVLSQSIEFNGRTFLLSDSVVTDVDLSQSDAVMYYQLLDSVVSLDLGLAVSFLQGSISVANSSDRASASFDEIIPMLYSRVRADLPLTGLWLGAEGQGVAYDGNSLLEFSTQIGWESRMGLGMEAGWRTVQFELEAFDEVDTAELDINGPYASINYHF